MKFIEQIKAKVSELTKSFESDEEKDFLMRPAEHLYVGFFSGIEKEVKDTTIDYIYSYAKDYELQKSRVMHRILPLKGHPYFGDGYAFEIQVGGDGFSYLDMIMNKFETKVKTLNFELDGEASVTIRKTPGNIETYYLADKTIAGDQEFTSIEEGRSVKSERLFTENYIYFYISSVLMVLGFAAMALALIYKYVWYENPTQPPLQTNVKFVNAMPVDNLVQARSTSTSRLMALSYGASTGWRKIKEERVPNSSERRQAIVQIRRDGTEVTTTSAEGGADD